VKGRSAIGTDIETGLATDTSFLIRHDCIGFGNSFPGTSRADRNARSLLALLTDNGHEDRNLFPFLYLYPRKGRTAGVLMGEAADHFAGLTSRTAFRNKRDSTHLDGLPILFSTVNDITNNIAHIFSLSSTFFEYTKHLYCVSDNLVHYRERRKGPPEMAPP
jgi:hypothetical protein